MKYPSKRSSTVLTRA